MYFCLVHDKVKGKRNKIKYRNYTFFFNFRATCFGFLLSEWIQILFLWFLLLKKHGSEENTSQTYFFFNLIFYVLSFWCNCSYYIYIYLMLLAFSLMNSRGLKAGCLSTWLRFLLLGKIMWVGIMRRLETRFIYT